MKLEGELRVEVLPCWLMPVQDYSLEMICFRNTTFFQ